MPSTPIPHNSPRNANSLPLLFKNLWEATLTASLIPTAIVIIGFSLTAVLVLSNSNDMPDGAGFVYAIAPLLFILILLPMAVLPVIVIFALAIIQSFKAKTFRLIHRFRFILYISLVLNIFPALLVQQQIIKYGHNVFTYFTQDPVASSLQKQNQANPFPSKLSFLSNPSSIVSHPLPTSCDNPDNLEDTPDLCRLRQALKAADLSLCPQTFLFECTSLIAAQTQNSQPCNTLSTTELTNQCLTFTQLETDAAALNCATSDTKYISWGNDECYDVVARKYDLPWVCYTHSMPSNVYYCQMYYQLSQHPLNTSCPPSSANNKCLYDFMRQSSNKINCQSLHPDPHVQRICHTILDRDSN